MHWPIYGLVAFGALLLAAPAFGASQKDVDDCSQVTDQERRIAGCTRVLNDRDQRNRPVAYYNRGRAWYAKKDYDRAIADFTESIHLDSKYALAYYFRGRVWDEKKNYDRAIADYDDAVRLDPKYAPAYFHRGVARYEKREYDRAIADYSEAIRLDPKYARAYHDRGYVWYLKFDYDRAIVDYDEAIRLNPKEGIYYNNRGSAWLGKGDYDRAIADSNEAIRRNPKLSAFYSNRGRAWNEKGDYDRAITDYTVAIGLEPNAARYRSRGQGYFNMGDFNGAAVDLLRANDLADDAYAMLWRYLARGRLGQDGSAELSANAARLKNKNWPHAVIEFYLGRRSLEEMRAAANKPDEKCQAEFYAGQWQILRGNPAESRAALQIAADTCRKLLIEYSGAVAELKRLRP